MCSIPLMIFEAFAMSVIAAQIAALDLLMGTCASTSMVSSWVRLIGYMDNTGRR
jgi:hypothetical protein